jgi:antitoxin ParD1/3/4
MIEKRTFSIPTEQAVYIDRLVDGGDYASASEVVRAGLRALRERESVTERWLQNEVIPVYDKMKKNPKRAIPAARVFAALRARHKSRSKKAKK